MLDVDALAAEIRRVDGSNSLGAGALAGALMPFLKDTALAAMDAAAADELKRISRHPYDSQSICGFFYEKMRQRMIGDQRYA